MNQEPERKDISVEEHFSRIEETIEQMEQGDISLNQSFALYQNGIKEIKAVNEMLDAMEKQILVISQEGNLEEF
ncbi:MAG: exodeoxyribonuclease VII small subunit [Agathobacter sp.]|nr:exodeoxyribonuclease VII small subunit [Agathobacter sp.]